MRITILGHASLFFESGSERVLLDPVLRTTPLMGSLVHQYPRALDRARMPNPTLVIITHAHFDHYDLETLRELPKDVPILIPTDKRMQRELTALGFTDLRRLGTWEALDHGSMRFVATPSDAPVVEFGVLAETKTGRLWHMSDAEAAPEAAARILRDHGPVDVLTAKFQPADPQLNYQHNLGSSFDRRAVAAWLETGCLVAPKLAFPYASGLCFEGECAWLNRYAYPFSAEHVAGLLQERLGAKGRAIVVRPGDTIVLDGRAPVVLPQASPFVGQARPEASVDWEPFDAEHLRGFADAEERRALVEELRRTLLEGDFPAWLGKHATEDGLLKAFRAWRPLCQLVVHLGGGERADFLVDFRGGAPKVSPGRSTAANYFTHVGGDAARRLLAGRSTPLAIMIEGSVRIYDRMIAVRDGAFTAPATTRLYEDFPDPFVSFGASRRRAARDALPWEL